MDVNNNRSPFASSSSALSRVDTEVPTEREEETNEVDAKEEDEKSISEQTKQAATYALLGLKIPPFYARISIKDFLILSVIQFMNELNDRSPLSSTAKALFIDLINNLNERPFNKRNQGLVKNFLEKLKPHLTQADLLTNPRSSFAVQAEHLTTLASLKLTGNEPISSFLPSQQQMPTSGTILSQKSIQRLSAYVDVLLFVIDDAFSNFLSKETIRENLEVIRRANPSMRDVPVDSLVRKLNTCRQRYENVVRIGIIKGLENIKNQLRNLTPESRDEAMYSIHQIQVHARVFHNILQSLVSDLQDMQDTFFDLLSTEELDGIRKQPDYLSPLSDHLVTLAEDTDALQASVVGRFQDIATMNTEQRAMISKIKQKLADPTKAKFLNDKKKQQSIAVLDAELKRMDQQDQQVGAVMQALAAAQKNMLSTLKGIVSKAKQEKAQVPALKAELTRRLPGFPIKLVGSIYKILSNLSYKVNTCVTGIDLLSKLIESNKRHWFDVAFPVAADVDYEQMWPAHHDTVARKTTMQSAIKVSLVEEETKEEVATGTLKPASTKTEAPKTTVSIPSRHDDVSALVQSFGRLTHEPAATLQPSEKVDRKQFATLSSQDASHQLKVLFGTIARVKKRFEQGRTDRLRALMFSVVRSAGIVTEENITAEHFIKRGLTNFSHSQVQMMRGITLPPSLSEQEQKEIHHLLGQLDFLVFGHRCPNNLQTMRERLRLPTPQGLEWMLHPDQIQPDNLIELIVGTLRFVECRSAGTEKPNHTLSDKIRKELGDALALGRSDARREVVQDVELTRAFDLKIASCEELADWIREKIAEAELRTDPIRLSLVNAYKDALSQVEVLQDNLADWSTETEDLASLGDAIWTNLQFLDEQLETALNMETNEEVLRDHSLTELRRSRGHVEPEAHSGTVANLDLGIDAQYIHYGRAMRNAQGRPSPLGLTWRFDSVEVSSHAEEIDRGMTVVGAKGAQITPEAPKQLRDQLTAMIDSGLAMIRTKM